MLIFMSLEFEEFSRTCCKLRWKGRLLLRYLATPDCPRIESPKPCFHPVHSLSGTLITDYRPSDHPWHHGIAFAPAYVDDDTFWGGPTFVDRNQRYQWRDNHGRQEHRNWNLVTSGPGFVCWEQEVDWRDHAEARIMQDTRAIAIEAPWRDEHGWRLSMRIVLRNLTQRTLRLASPVCQGRESGGYFGLMWRGAPALAGSRLFTSAHTGTDVMDRRASWLACISPAAGVSVLLIDDAANPRHPTPWFARNNPLLASFALVNHEPWFFLPGEVLALRYQIIISDRLLDEEEAAREATEAGAARQNSFLP